MATNQIPPKEERGLPDPRPVGDFYGPTFNVELTSLLSGTDVTAVAFDTIGITGKSISVRSSDSDGSINDLVLKINSSLTAESKAGSPFRFVLTMTPEYEDGLLLLNTQSIGYATMARVQWGYVSSSGVETLTRKHVFRNIQPKAKFGENIQIILDGWDMFTDTSARRNLNATRKGTVLQFITKLAKRVNYIVNVPKKLEEDKKHPLNKTPKYKSQQHLTDLQLMKKLLREAKGLTFAIRNDAIDIYDPKVTRLKNKVDYTFKWRQELTGPRDIPVYSMDANFLQYFFQPPAGRGLKVLCSDPETGKTKARNVDARDTEGKAPVILGGTSGNNNISSFNEQPAANVTPPDKKQIDQVPPKSTESEEVGTKLSCPPNADIAVDPGIGGEIVKQAEIMGSPMLKIRAPGVTDMFPGLQVEIKGAANAFDGIYHVLTVKHSLTGGGYDMDVELFRWFTKRPGAPEGETVNQSPSKGDDTSTPPNIIAFPQ